MDRRREEHGAGTLEDVADARGQLRHAQPARILSIEFDHALARSQQAQRLFDHRRLARTVGAEQGNRFAAPYLRRDAVQYFLRVDGIAEAHIFKGEDGFICRLLAAVLRRNWTYKRTAYLCRAARIKRAQCGLNG